MCEELNVDLALHVKRRISNTSYCIDILTSYCPGKKRQVPAFRQFYSSHHSQDWALSFKRHKGHRENMLKARVVDG